MRFGRILGVLVVLLLIGGAATGFWYWKSRGGAIRAASALPVLENDSTLSHRVSELHDSLQHLDFALREAQLADSEPPVDLARRQSELWSRYTWARARLSDVRDAKMDTSKATVPDADGLGKVLGSLALYLWVAAGVAALALAFMIWWFLGRRSHESEIPLTEPTLTRMDRNVRMPLSGGDGAGSRTPLREATFSQIRAARAGAEPAASDRGPSPDPDLPSAPPPKTGRHAWENTTNQPGAKMPAPAEPTVVQDYVVSMAKRGRTSSEIARRLRIPQDQVDLILKLRRNG
jgi:flagellar basal body-associated protein FliL